MAWTKRRKHLSRAARAQARQRCEQRRQQKAEQRRQVAARADKAVTIRDKPRRRDVDYLVSDCVGRANLTFAERYRAILDAALARRPGLLDPPYRDGLRILSAQDWLREPALWRPGGRGLGEAFRSLAAHLHGDYPVCPRLWDGLLTPAHTHGEHATSLAFIAKVACGISPRGLVGTVFMPAPLTRRMLHLALHPPRPMSLVASVRRAQVLAYGGPERLAGELYAQGLDEFLEDEDYWATVIHWFCRQGRLEKDAYETIVDHLFAMLLQREPVAIGGRTPQSLLRDRARYLKAVAEARKREEPLFFEPEAPPAAPRCDLVDHRDGDWQVARIRTARKLILEGALMRHCVGWYTSDLKCGRWTYWSLTRQGRRTLTISVCTVTREVRSIAGRGNREARREELAPVVAWARRNGLEIDEWLEDWRSRGTG